MSAVEKKRAASRAYHAANRERLLAEARARYAANKEHYRARAKKWHHENRERALESMRKWHRENGYKRIGRTRQQRYGISPQEYDAMFSAQNSGCAICGCVAPKSKQGWHVDHDHASGKVRAILCHNCNCGIGHAKESPEILRKMIEYLSVHAREDV